MRLDSGMSLQQEVGWSRDVLRMARYVHVIVRVWSQDGQAHNVIVDMVRVWPFSLSNPRSKTMGCICERRGHLRDIGL